MNKDMVELALKLDFELKQQAFLLCCTLNNFITELALLKAITREQYVVYEEKRPIDSASLFSEFFIRVHSDDLLCVVTIDTSSNRFKYCYIPKPLFYESENDIKAILRKNVDKEGLLCRNKTFYRPLQCDCCKRIGGLGRVVAGLEMSVGYSMTSIYEIIILPYIIDNKEHWLCLECHKDTIEKIQKNSML
jgi:hypothetical protein